VTTGLNSMLQLFVLLQAQNDIKICESANVEGQAPDSSSQSFNSAHHKRAPRFVDLRLQSATDLLCGTWLRCVKSQALQFGMLRFSLCFNDGMRAELS
jgi:hypothetical protein